MIVRNDKTKFEKFQNLLREANYKNIPTTKNECWKVDSFDLFQGHIKGKIKRKIFSFSFFAIIFSFLSLYSDVFFI